MKKTAARTYCVRAQEDAPKDAFSPPAPSRLGRLRSGAQKATKDSETRDEMHEEEGFERSVGSR